MVYLTLQVTVYHPGTPGKNLRQKLEAETPEGL